MAFAHRTYATDSRFKVVKPFTMNGVSYEADDPVDVTGIEPRRVRLMFEARIIDVDERDPAAIPVKAARPPEPPPQAGGAPAQAPAATGGHKLKNGGFGRWYIANAEGENVAGPFTGGSAKADAEAALAKMQ